MIFKPALILLALAASSAIATTQEPTVKLADLLARFSGTICFAEFEKSKNAASYKLAETNKGCEIKCQDEISAIQNDTEIKYNQLFDISAQHFISTNECNYKERADDRLKCLKTESLSGSKKFYDIHTNSTKILDISEEEIRRAEKKKGSCISDSLDEFAQDMIMSTVQLNDCITK